MELVGGVTSQLQFVAECDPNQSSQNLTVELTISLGYSRILLNGSVGEGVLTPNKLDVYRVQQRLRYFSFRGRKSSPSDSSPTVSVDGQNNNAVFIQAIRACLKKQKEAMFKRVGGA